MLIPKANCTILYSHQQDNSLFNLIYIIINCHITFYSSSNNTNKIVLNVMTCNQGIFEFRLASFPCGISNLNIVSLHIYITYDLCKWQLMGIILINYWNNLGLSNYLTFALTCLMNSLILRETMTYYQRNITRHSWWIFTFLQSKTWFPML